MRALLGVLSAATAVVACGPNPSSAPTPTQLTPNCVVGLSLMEAREPSWRGAEPALAEPEIIEAAAPQLVACAARLPDGRFVAYRIRVSCVGSLERNCTRIADAHSEAVVDGGRRAASGDYASYKYASHCVNGLGTAQDRGLVDPDRSSLDFPWRITGEREPRGSELLTCGIVNMDRTETLRVRVLCDDPDRGACTEFLDHAGT